MRDEITLHAALHFGQATDSYMRIQTPFMTPVDVSSPQPGFKPNAPVRASPVATVLDDQLKLTHIANFDLEAERSAIFHERRAPQVLAVTAYDKDHAAAVAILQASLAMECLPFAAELPR